MKRKSGVFCSLFLFFLVGQVLSQSVQPLWKTYKIGQYPFSIESPFPLQTEHPPAHNSFQLFMRTFVKTDGDFVVYVTVAEPNKKIELKDIPEKIFKQVSQKIQISDMKVSSKMEMFSGCPGILTIRTFKQGKTILSTIKELDVCRDKTWFNMMVWYDLRDEKLDQMADRVINSFLISN